MKRVFLPLLISLSLLCSAPSVYADNHGRGHDRKEQRDHKDRKEQRDHKDRKDRDKHKDNRKDYRKDDRRHNDRYGHPAPPPPPRHDFGYRHQPPRPVYGRPAPPPPTLGHMVRHACRGARNLRVWEINPGVYLLRYLLNGRWYMQEVYPSRNAYGRRIRVYQNNDYWYNDDGYRYYDRGSGLSINFDGRDLYNGIVKPRIHLNISL